MRVALEVVRSVARLAARAPRACQTRSRSGRVVLSLLSLVPVCVLGLVACGGTSSATGTTAGDGTSVGPDTDPVTPLEPAPKEPPDAGPTCDLTLASATVEEALVATDPATEGHVWIVRARDGETFVTLTVRESAGAAHGPSNGSFGAEQLSPPEAAVSLLVQTECHAHEDHYHCGPSFVPETGMWALTALGEEVGDRVAGRIDAHLVQAKVSASSAKPIANGKRLCVAGLAFEATLAAAR